MTTAILAQVIAQMQQAAPTDLEKLDDEQADILRAMTRELAATKPDATAEYERFLGIQYRSLTLPDDEIAVRLDGKVVLVTGGTGCIGSTLMAQLAMYQPRRLVSVSRGVMRYQPVSTGIDYLYCDVSNREAITRLITAVKPDIIFHVAAQRSPALAEVEVHRTITTNVLGTCNVLMAASAAGVPQVVLASTGKALRPYSPEVYTASKRAAEWLATLAAAGGKMLVSASRFTHVIDNSIVHGRLLGWAASGEPLRLHSPHIVFYVQSALESAQLLLLAMLSAEHGEFRVNAITDLGWPVSLVDVALGVRTVTGSHSPVYFSGYDPGYEEVPYPGLYDPVTAGDVSPLLNAFEAAATTIPPVYSGTDTFQLEITSSYAASEALTALESVCYEARDSREVYQALGNLSWELLRGTITAANLDAVTRSVQLAGQHESELSPVHRRVLEVTRNLARISQ